MSSIVLREGKENSETTRTYFPILTRDKNLTMRTKSFKETQIKFRRFSRHDSYGQIYRIFNHKLRGKKNKKQKGVEGTRNKIQNYSSANTQQFRNKYFKIVPSCHV